MSNSKTSLHDGSGYLHRLVRRAREIRHWFEISMVSGMIIGTVMTLWLALPFLMWLDLSPQWFVMLLILWAGVLSGTICGIAFYALDRDYR